MIKILKNNLQKCNVMATSASVEDLLKDLMLIYGNDKEFIKAAFENGNFILIELNGEIQLLDNW